MTSSLKSKRILIASDVRGVRTEAGVATTHPAGLYSNFLTVAAPFRSGTVISRDATDSRATQSPGGLMTGELVSYRGVPDYGSFAGLARTAPATALTVWRALREHDVAYVRLPEPLSIIVGMLALIRRRPLVVNMVADPRTLGGDGGRSAVRWLLTRATSYLVRRAAGVIYVTQHQLQKHFPCPPSVPALVRSNVRIDEVADQPRPAPKAIARLLTVGVNSGLAKGQDLVIEAVALLRHEGLPVELELVGGGDRTDWLRRRAQELGVTEFVTLRGHLDDPAEVRAAYDSADVFCLPSRSEGLPRAMVEAMARGLPSVGSRVGGIPELVPEHRLMRRLTASDLAARVRELISTDSSYEDASRDAIRRASEIRDQARPARLHEFLAGILR